MKKLVNLNPHKIVVEVEGKQVVFEPAAEPCRIKVTQAVADDINGIPVVENVYGAIEGLPIEIERTVYIVNALILAALKNSRKDCVAPDTGPTAIRENGQVTAVKRFCR